MAMMVLNNGDPFSGGGIFANQRVPAVVEFPVDFRTNQIGVFESLPGALDTVATYAHPFEFVAGGVKLKSMKGVAISDFD